MNKHISIVIIILFSICSFLFSQEEYSPDDVFIINSFNFNVDGITRSYALIRTAELIEGEEITGFSNLESYIQEKTQLLLNERILESASIAYTIGEAQADGKYPVDLVIDVKDTWNIVAIPRPQYSTNTGFDITIKARDYNFLGTMQSLRLDLGYRYNELGQSFFNIMLDSNIPFRLFNLNWDISFYNYFDYRPNLELPFHFKNVTGLSVELPIKLTTLTVGFKESFIVNEQNSETNMALYNLDEFQEGLYMSSNPYISWKIPTSVTVGNYGNLIFTPSMSATFYHELPKWPLDSIRQGPYLSFSHSLGFGRIDWKKKSEDQIENFLSGLDVGISNSFSYNFFDLGNEHHQLSSYLGVTGKWHIAFENIFGISSRLMYRQWFLTKNGNDAAGDVLRGIRDKDISADYMFSLNFDIAMKILKFRPTDWFSRPKLRILNFDMHAVPFVDAAIYRSPYNETNFSGMDFTFKNMLVSCGMELIIFPEFFNSLFLRASIGFNLSTLTENYNGKPLSNYELFIGTELHY